jgi:ankyrin repeat protein
MRVWTERLFFLIGVLFILALLAAPFAIGWKVLWHQREVTAQVAARDNALLLAVREGNSTKVKSLLADGAASNARDADGQTALSVAAESPVTCTISGMGTDGQCHYIEKHRGYAEVVAALVKHGAEVNVRNRDGITPLQQAQSFDEAETVRLLIKAGAVENLTKK